jgi:hypothetical protein
MTQHARLTLLSVALGLTLSAPVVRAWEGDVHFGLTFWLARSAGFEEREARAIATGDHRVDSGDMQYIEPMFLYACLGADDVGGKRAGGGHYAAAAAYPAPAAARAVHAASASARDGVNAMLKVAPQQAGLMLQKFGEALHPFQDTWAHQGTPDVPPEKDLGFACDASRAWAHPKERGGWNSHKADLTAAWPNDTVAMAKATYEALTRYPDVAGVKRTAQPWDKLRAQLDGFIKVASKADKAKWFRAQGVEDVSFLEGATLRDGTPAFEEIWPGRRFPPVPTDQTRQHHVDETVLDFFHAFFAAWVTTKDFNAVAARYATASRKTELASRLKLWRLRDHGRVAEIAHSLQPLSAGQRAAVDAAAKEKSALAIYPNPMDAFFPILPRTGTSEVSPLLPFFVKVLSTDPAAASKKDAVTARVVAVVKFRQAPYDLLAVTAEQAGSVWRIRSIVPLVDH